MATLIKGFKKGVTVKCTCGADYYNDSITGHKSDCQIHKIMMAEYRGNSVVIVPDDTVKQRIPIGKETQIHKSKKGKGSYDRRTGKTTDLTDVN